MFFQAFSQMTDECPDEGFLTKSLEVHTYLDLSAQRYLINIWHVFSYGTLVDESVVYNFKS